MILFGDLVDNPETQLFKRPKLYPQLTDSDPEKLRYLMERDDEQSHKTLPEQN
jgi:hypothetical protein